MNGIIRTVWDTMENAEPLKNALLMVAGDHGMNAGGNHDGSGPAETEPALVLASPKFAGHGKQ